MCIYTCPSHSLFIRRVYPSRMHSHDSVLIAQNHCSILLGRVPLVPYVRKGEGRRGGEGDAQNDISTRGQVTSLWHLKKCIRDPSENNVVFRRIDDRIANGIISRPAGRLACVSWNCGEPVWRRASFVFTLSLSRTHAHTCSLSLAHSFYRVRTFISLFLAHWLASSPSSHLFARFPLFLSLFLSRSLTYSIIPDSLLLFRSPARAFLTHAECRSFNISCNLLLYSTLLSRAISRHPRVYACHRDIARAKLRIRASHSRVSIESCFGNLITTQLFAISLKIFKHRHERSKTTPKKSRRNVRDTQRNARFESLTSEVGAYN